MIELWARKRPINGKGFPYELIFNFDNQDYKFSAIETLDEEIYQECMIIEDNKCVMYKELEKPYVKRK